MSNQKTISLGQAVIDAVIASKALERAEICASGTPLESVLFIWRANAAEQIEVALAPFFLGLGLEATKMDEWIAEGLGTFLAGVKTFGAPPHEAMRRAFGSIYLRMMGLEPPTPEQEGRPA